MKHRLLGIGFAAGLIIAGGFYFLFSTAPKPSKLKAGWAKTIDVELMNACQLAFPSGKQGAIVVIDPRNGRVLADYSTLGLSAGDDPAHSEMHTAPGATIFPLIALAGSPTGLDTKTFDCGGGRRFGSKFMKCWIVNRPEKSHGQLDLVGGITNSCNGFFYRYSTEVGISEILTTTDLFGLGRKSSLAARNQSHIPDPEWLKWQGLQWSPAFTALVAIGQGATEVSPLQMAKVYATFANGGIVYDPTWDSAGPGDIITDFATLPQYKQATFNQIRIALRAGVNDSVGKGSNAKSDDFVIAGQTGTVQTGNPKKPINAWFCGFAPFENPTVAIAVFVKDGVSGNTTAAPVAKEIIEFALKNSPPNS